MRPGGADPGLSTAATSNSPPYPAPGCPPGFSYLPPPSSPSNTESFVIYPMFTRNASGSYDGHDHWFGYEAPNAIPAGGDPSQVQLGAPATTENMAGHVIGVRMVINASGTWEVEWPKWQGQCSVGHYGFGGPFIGGDAPPPSPPATVLANPPFGLGPTLLANVTGRWPIGSIGILPGPGNTARTFVHIPTCAWLDSGVPTEPVLLHAVTTAQSDGYTLFLVYNLSVTPGAVIWDWGDGSQTASVGAPEAPPPTLPSYDPVSETWTNPCSASHNYTTVSAGRTITATQTFDVVITVSWNDGVQTHTQAVACDRATGGPCALTIGPGQGWQSGPHPVDQIEPVPFNPQSG